MKQTTISKFAMSVYVDGNSMGNLPLQIPADIASLNWFNDSVGSIFKTDGSEEKITSFPSWAQQCVDVYNMSLPVPPEPPPMPLTMQASTELYATDWTSIPDITDPTKCTPTLTNQQEFLDYRNQLRAIVLGLHTGLPALPPKPTAQWST